MCSFGGVGSRSPSAKNLLGDGRPFSAATCKSKQSKCSISFFLRLSVIDSYWAPKNISTALRHDAFCVATKYVLHSSRFIAAVCEVTTSCRCREIFWKFYRKGKGCDSWHIGCSWLLTLIGWSRTTASGLRREAATTTTEDELQQIVFCCVSKVEIIRTAMTIHYTKNVMYLLCILSLDVSTLSHRDDFLLRRWYYAHSYVFFIFHTRSAMQKIVWGKNIHARCGLTKL